jgi:UDP-2-acetamido-3-amino-2,3-dideoxy-glucuronate N-acetyltransferase
MSTLEREPPYFVHPSSVIDEGATIGSGSRIWHFCHVCSGAVLGERCVLGQNVFVADGTRVGNGAKIQNNVSIYAGVELEDNVFCGPSMVFTNVINPRAFIERKSEYQKTLVGRGATLGANCTILCGVTIGRYALIGAGAVVRHDVADYALILGVPGRRRGWVCRCGTTLDAAHRCPACAMRYREVDGRLQPMEQIE